MITISLCMIVKNEAAVLRRCLDSLKGIYDEAIIVDTGSTDETRKIAYEYTDKVYDFKWIDDFSAARNFAMSKASMDYIYMADADEVLDEENRQRFLLLKKAMLEEIEIVQMRYKNQLSHGTVYNYDNELRGKLYKRLRNFTFIDPIHEVVRTQPVVYDSDIEIIHMPESLHSSRDLAIFDKAIKRDGKLSNRLITMYAKELLLCADRNMLSLAKEYFNSLYLNPENLDEEDLKVVYIVLSKICQAEGDIKGLMTFSLKEMATGGSCEICCILGNYYEENEDYDEAIMWYYNAIYETKPLICLSYANRLPMEGMVRIYDKLGNEEEKEKYINMISQI